MLTRGHMTNFNNYVNLCELNSAHINFFPLYISLNQTVWLAAPGHQEKNILQICEIGV